MTKNKKRYLPSLLITLVVILFIAYIIRDYVSVPMSKINFSDNSKLNRKEIENIIGEYISNNPKAILDSVENYAKKSASNNIITVEESDLATLNSIFPTIGKKDANLTVTIIHDMQCGYCKKLANNVIAIKNSNPDLKFILAEMPILGETSNLISKTAIAINKIAPDSYYEFYKKMMASPRMSGEEELSKIITELGLDVNKIKEVANSEEVKAKLDSASNFAAKYNIRGTPATIIGNQLYQTYLSVDQLKQLINEQINKPQ